MIVRFIGYTDKGGNLIQGKVYEAHAIWGPLIAVTDESGGKYFYPNNEHIFEVVDPLPAPRIKPYEPMTPAEAKEKYPEFYV